LHNSQTILPGKIPARITQAMENDSAQTHVNQASDYLNDSQYDLAISECTKAIELDPNLYIAYINRASAYSMKGQYDQVVNDCNMAIQLVPDLPLAYLSRAMAYRSLGRKNEALKDFEKLITLTGSSQLIKIAQKHIEELS
jgi:tetratricopeptide (TPR) repeat protein